MKTSGAADQANATQDKSVQDDEGTPPLLHIIANMNQVQLMLIIYHYWTVLWPKNEAPKPERDSLFQIYVCLHVAHNTAFFMSMLKM